MTHSLYAQGMVSFMQSPISTDDDDTTAPEVAVFESSREYINDTRNNFVKNSETIRTT